MRINTENELIAWDLNWPDGEPGPWELSVERVKQALGQSPAIGVYWIGYSGGTHSTFQPKYCGKAVRQPLAQRLRQHAVRSHNKHIRDHLPPKKAKPAIWFRFVEFATMELADCMEGLMIAAFREEYEWNGRNEWTQHWALEDY